jgi:hypothetical protein
MARTKSRLYYLRLLFLTAGRFLPADLLAALAAFLGDFLAGLALDFLPALAVLVLDDERPPLKILSQLSEYCFVAPTRTTLMREKLLKMNCAFLVERSVARGRRRNSKAYSGL